MAASNFDVLVVGVVCIWLLTIYNNAKKAPLPKGPRGWPLIGNIPQMPHSQEWNTYAKWAEEYGPITCLRLPNSYIIVINTLKAAKELMDERAPNYSNRPFSAMNKLCELDWVVTNCDGEMHRRHRALVHRYFSGSAALKHRDHQQDEARRFLYNILCDPSNLLGNIKLHATSAILMGSYGFRLDSSKDPLIEDLDRTFEYSHRFPANLATSLFEIFPFIKHFPHWLPGFSFLKTAEQIKEAFGVARDKPYLRAKQLMEKGTSKPSFLSTSLSDLEADTSISTEDAKARESLIVDCASAMYGAGSDSSVATMGTFFLEMLINPSIFKRAQDEMDSVTGGERLPVFADRENLSYIEALFLETLRVNTVTPLGLPHSVVEDDDYQGNLIPGGAMICVNIWLILHDPKVYPDPHTFNPDRFLGLEGGIQRETLLNVIWGFGRRVCPGRQLAEASLFIAMASVIAAFDILLPKDSARPTEYSFTSGYIRHPELVPMTVRPRSQKWRDIVEEAAQVI